MYFFFVQLFSLSIIYCLTRSHSWCKSQENVSHCDSMKEHRRAGKAVRAHSFELDSSGESPREASRYCCKRWWRRRRRRARKFTRFFFSLQLQPTTANGFNEWCILVALPTCVLTHSIYFTFFSFYLVFFFFPFVPLSSFIFITYTHVIR